MPIMNSHVFGVWKECGSHFLGRIIPLAGDDHLAAADFANHQKAVTWPGRRVTEK